MKCHAKYSMFNIVLKEYSSAIIDKMRRVIDKGQEK